MHRRLRASFTLGVCLASTPTLAQEPTGTPPAAAETAPPPSEPASTDAPSEGWHTEVSGYFRAPVAIGISSRSGPDEQPMGPPNEQTAGPKDTQLSYGPNRTVDSSYFSFAYTRLQETDWAEVFIHAKKRHVDAAVGWMGYWYQSAGFRNPDASWVPGMAYITLDTDFDLAGLRPNVALTMGAWWPSFGSFPKYDTYTLGRFRQIGEQVKLSVALNPDVQLAFTEGFGTSRDGSFNYGAPPLYGAQVGLDLMTWEHLQVSYKEYVDLGIHYNTEWISDPNLAPGRMIDDKSYIVQKEAHLSVLGAELTLSAPYAGRLWISPSYLHVRNGWGLGNGTEVMHSLGGIGIANNYMAWNNAPDSSTGSGSMLNLGFLYENTLSGVQGKAPGALPEVTLNIFGLMANASLDLPEYPPELPAASRISQDSIKQFKYGADATVQLLTWLSVMLRYDAVNHDLDHEGYVYAAITPRVTVASHYLSGERLFLQYSRYIYGDKMVLNASWPWGTPLVAGTNVLQAGVYNGQTPDENVIKMQADIAF